MTFFYAPEIGRSLNHAQMVEYRKTGNYPGMEKKIKTPVKAPEAPVEVPETPTPVETTVVKTPKAKKPTKKTKK